MLLAIDPHGLDVRRVDSHGDGHLFPHIQQVIPLASVSWAIPFPADRNGRRDWFTGEPIVARAVSTWTPTIHALLDHMRGSGAVPEPLGVADGLEFTTFVAGDTPRYPVPAWMREDAAMISLGAVLRTAHDAAAGFDPPGPFAVGLRSVDDTVCHGDIGPGNVVWREGTAHVLIDWELAEPRPRVHDLAWCAITLAALGPADRLEAMGLAGLDADRRIALLCEGYGDFSVPDVRAGAVRALELEIDRYTGNRPPWSEFATPERIRAMERTLHALRD